MNNNGEPRPGDTQELPTRPSVNPGDFDHTEEMPGVKPAQGPLIDTRKTGQNNDTHPVAPQRVDQTIIQGDETGPNETTTELPSIVTSGQVNDNPNRAQQKAIPVELLKEAKGE